MTILLMHDIKMIVSTMLQQSMSYLCILEVYKFLLMLAQGFRVISRPLKHLVSIWVFSRYLYHMYLRDFRLQNFPEGEV